MVGDRAMRDLRIAADRDSCYDVGSYYELTPWMLKAEVTTPH